MTGRPVSPAEIFSDENRAAGLVEPRDDRWREPLGNVLQGKVFGAEPALGIVSVAALTKTRVPSANPTEAGSPRRTGIGDGPRRGRPAQCLFDPASDLGVGPSGHQFLSQGSRIYVVADWMWREKVAASPFPAFGWLGLVGGARLATTAKT